MNTFPTLDRSPDIQGFVDEYSDESIQIGSFASGYPCINKLFTFDPRTWTYTLSYVSQSDKTTLMSFYLANKDVPFYWLNEQEDIVFEVIFVGKPSCRIQDNDDNDSWQIGMTLRQSADTELSGNFLTNRYYGGDAMIEIENLSPGADITLRPVFVAGSGMVITSAWLMTKGTPAGIDNSNTVVLTIKNEAGNTLLTKTYNTATQPPTNDSVDLSSLLDSDYTTLAEGDILTITVTQGTTANMPAFSITFGGYYT